LTEIDVDGTGIRGADGWEKVERFEMWVNCFFEFFTITSKENCSCPWTVSNANDIAFMI
jgi:hypothetical protein